MKDTLRAIGYSLDLLPTPPVLALPNAMCCEEARAGSENSVYVEEKLYSVDEVIRKLIMKEKQ